MRSPGTFTPLIAAALGLLGCSGAAPEGAKALSPTADAPAAATAGVDPNTVAPTAETKSAPSPQETAQARRESCQAAAQAIQQAQQNDVLLNIHNSRTVLELAEVLEEAADRIEQIEPAAALGPLKELLAKYSGTSRSMARALAATADANSVEDRKAPLGEFRELEPRLRGVVSDIGAYCNAG